MSIGLILAAVGCGGGGTTMTTTTTTLLTNKQESFLNCFRDGPFKIPDGASVTYDITDSGDSMEVGVANDLDGCDLTNGQAITNNTNWQGEVMKSTGSLPGASYALVFFCNDASYTCSPTVYSLSYAN